jgi:flagellar hook-length control protein FliK
VNTSTNTGSVDLLALVATPTASVASPLAESIDPVGTFLTTLADLIVPMESLNETVSSLGSVPTELPVTDDPVSVPLPVDGLMMYLQVAQMPLPAVAVSQGVDASAVAAAAASPLPTPAASPLFSAPVGSAETAAMELSSKQSAPVAKVAVPKASAKPQSQADQSRADKASAAPMTSDDQKADSVGVLPALPDLKPAGESVLAAAQAVGTTAIGPLIGNNGADVWVVGQPQPASSQQPVDDVRTPQGTAPAELQERVGSARWADDLATRITLMTAQGQQQGSLRLSPEHLGPLEVRIHVTQDTASVWFGAQHDETRAAIQDALPRLREMFAASGISLGQASVSRQAPRQNQSSHPGSRTQVARDDFVTHEISAPSRTRLGLVDTYA